MSELSPRQRQMESDRKLLAHWLEQREFAQKALDTANRQIEYLSNFMIRCTIEEPTDTEDTSH